MCCGGPKTSLDQTGSRVNRQTISLVALLVAVSCAESPDASTPRTVPPAGPSILGIPDVTALIKSSTPESEIREIESRLAAVQDVACVQVTTPRDSLADFEEAFPGVDLKLKDAVWVVEVALAQTMSTGERRILSGEIADLLRRSGTLERVGIGMNLSAPEEWLPPSCIAQSND